MAGARPALRGDCCVCTGIRGMALSRMPGAFERCRSSTSLGVDSRLPARGSMARACCGGHSRLEAGMAALFDTFRDAPILGSLIDPTRTVPTDMFTAGFQELGPLLNLALREHGGEEEWEESALVARGITEACRLLSSQYHLVVTNVPYLVRSKQGQRLRSFVDHSYPDSAADLATVFLERIALLCAPGGAHATVTPQNWLSLKSYQRFRKSLIRSQTLNHVCRVGSGATATASWDVLRTLAIVTNSTPRNESVVTGLETSESTEQARARDLISVPLASVLQSTQLTNPEHRIAVRPGTTGALLCEYAESLQGVKTGDDPRRVRFFWEVSVDESGWRPFQGTVSRTVEFGGLERVLDWRDEGVSLARRQGMSAWGANGCRCQSNEGASCIDLSWSCIRQQHISDSAARSRAFRCAMGILFFNFLLRRSEKIGSIACGFQCSNGSGAVRLGALEGGGGADSTGRFA
jgi:hypothetical protein